jgi:ankyrin repeat protein
MMGRRDTLRGMTDMTSLDEFRSAVNAGDAGRARRILEGSADVRAAINEPLFGFDAPALNAAGSDLAMIDLLLEFGADPNRRSAWWAGGFHPLHLARGAAAARLIAGGAIIDACAAANLDRLDVLLQLLASDPSLVHERGGDGQTPLHFARSRAVIDALLDAGADIDARDRDHRATAAEWMIGDADRRELARYLVERGATADIFLAAALGLTARAKAMLEANPSLLALRTSQGEYAEQTPSSFHIYQWTIGPNRTPLQTASKFGQRYTLNAMAVFATPSQRLMLACHEGDRDTAWRIVRADPGIVQNLGPADQRALTDEAWAANANAVALMLELGFDPGISSGDDNRGGNALHCASWEGSVDCVRAILEHPRGRELIESRDRTWDGTPLGWCCHGSLNCGNPHADHGAVASMLIGAGAVVTREMLDWNASPACTQAIRNALATS